MPDDDELLGVGLGAGSLDEHAASKTAIAATAGKTRIERSLLGRDSLSSNLVLDSNSDSLSMNLMPTTNCPALPATVYALSTRRHSKACPATPMQADRLGHTAGWSLAWTCSAGPELGRAEL